jgi:hypothetical protein
MHKHIHTYFSPHQNSYKFIYFIEAINEEGWGLTLQLCELRYVFAFHDYALATVAEQDEHTSARGAAGAEGR